MENSQKNGFAIASMVLGICSIVFGICLGGILGVLGIIFGIIALSKKQGKQGFAIVGLVTATVGLLIFVGIIIVSAVIYSEDGNLFGDTMNTLIEEAEADRDASSDRDASGDGLKGNTYIAEDGSELVLNSDRTFEWYMEEDQYDDNYVRGYFEVYYQDEAENVLVNEMPDYGITQSELQDYYDSNTENELYSKENLCVLILHNEMLIVDGEDQLDEGFAIPYMGFYMDGYFDAANMKSAEYEAFQLKE